MNINYPLGAIASLILSLVISVAAVSQEHELKRQKQRDTSIKKMQDRIAQIEKEISQAETARANVLGEEVFGLLGQIDQTFLEMKTTYQQQVIQLNQRMQREWERLESAKESDRAEIDKQLAELETDWDQTFLRLTRAHDNHLQQLNKGLAKLRGDFSSAAGRAKIELEASNFEAKSRWEESHEVFLAINQTYVQIVQDQVKWLQEQTAQRPAEESLTKRLNNARTRFASIQVRLHKRLQSHLGHLEEELLTRRTQLTATIVWETRREIMELVDDLYLRKHTTFENLQKSLRESIAVFDGEHNELTEESERGTELKKEIAALKLELRQSYLSRVLFIERQLDDLASRMNQGATEEEKSKWTAKSTDLRLLSRDLRRKAGAINRTSQTNTILR